MRKLFHPGRPAGRLFYCMISVLVAVGVSRGAPPPTPPATTTISDVIYRADGSTAAGTLLITWPAFTTADNRAVPAGSMSLAIGAFGAINLALVPNQGATPAGTYYKVVMKLNDGTTSQEFWVVPTLSPTTISAIRSQVVPAGVALQVVTRQYVDDQLATKADNASVVHRTGDESVAGVKQFTASPTVPTPTADPAAANKAYVDAAVASVNASNYVLKSGDTMTGLLTLGGNPTQSLHASTKSYVDTQVGTRALDSAVVHLAGAESITGVKAFSASPTVPTPVTDTAAANKAYVDSVSGSPSSGGVRFADLFPGADAGAKIAACIAALPSTGGTCDARGLMGAQTWTSDPFLGVTTKVNLILGAATFTISANTTVPANVALNASQGTVLSPNSGITLTVNGPFFGTESGNIGGAGTVTFGSAGGSTGAPRLNANGSALQDTTATSSISKPVLQVLRTDTSPPVGGAGVLNNWYAPANMFRVNSSGGGVSGSHGVALFYMPSVSGKTTTTITSAVTGSGIAQSIAVADSSVFTAGDGAQVDSGQGSAKTEIVTITAVSDSTHVTGIFTKNHSAGTLIFVLGKGDKIGAGISMSDAAASTNSLFGINTNLTMNSTAPGHAMVGEEVDLTNNTAGDAAKYVYDMTTGGSVLIGKSIGFFGPGGVGRKSTVGLSISSGDGLSQAWNAIALEGAGVNGIVFTTGGTNALRSDVPIRIQAASTAGIVIGANQAAATNPNYSLFDPTDAIFLTARTQAEGTTNAASNKLTFQSIGGSVTHTMGVTHQEQAGGLLFLRDGATLNSFIGTDGSFNNRTYFNARDSGGTIRARFGTGGSASAADLTQLNGGTLSITATTLTMSGGTVDSEGATVTRPFRRLAFASFPGSCTANREFLERSDPAAAGQVLYLCNSTGNGWDLVGDGGGGGGANTSLSNLAAVAVSASLVPGLDNAIDLGSSGLGWKDVYAKGVMDAGSGFRMAGGAGSGNVLRGNGTNFVSATLACADVTNCPSLVASGTAGVGPSKAGTASTAARSDHDHRSFATLTWYFPGTPSTGVSPMILAVPQGIANGTITGMQVTVATTSASSSTSNLQRCTAGCTGASPTFSNIYSSDNTLGANTSEADFGTTNLTTTLNAKDQFKANLVTIGAGLANVTITLSYKYDTTN